MRIHSFDKISQMYKTNASSKAQRTNAYGGSDQVQISQLGKDFQIAKNAVKNSSDIRTDKVDAIKKQMEQGTYQVSNKEVADKMIDRFFDTKI